MTDVPTTDDLRECAGDAPGRPNKLLRWAADCIDELVAKIAALSDTEALNLQLIAEVQRLRAELADWKASAWQTVTVRHKDGTTYEFERFDSLEATDD